MPLDPLHRSTHNGLLLIVALVNGSSFFSHRTVGRRRRSRRTTQHPSQITRVLPLSLSLIAITLLLLILCPVANTLAADLDDNISKKKEEERRRRKEMSNNNQVLVETAIGIIWVILRIIELYLWLPTRLYGAFCSFHVASSSTTDQGSRDSDTTNNRHSSNGANPDADADEGKKNIPTVVIVGGNFAGLAALWPLLDKQSPYVGFPKFRIVLIDQRDYSEYTPGILRLFVRPNLIDTLAQPLPSTPTTVTSTPTSFNVHPCHDYRFIHGKVESILEQKKVEGEQKKSSSSGNSLFRKVLTYSSPVTSSTPSSLPANSSLKTLEYDYLILATGMTYRQSPITPDPQSESSLQERLQSWKRSHQQLKEAKKIIVLGGGAVGVELVAEIVDDEALMNDGPNRKQITLIDVAPELVMNFPPDVRSYAKRWLERQPGVDVKLNQKLKSWTDKSCTLEDGTILHADIVYVCFGSKPNSEPVASKTNSGGTINTLLGDTVRGRLYTTDTLQVAYDKTEGRNNITQSQDYSSSVLHDGCIFACGDVATPPSSDEKQAFQAESQGKVAAHNVIKMMTRNNNDNTDVVLDRYPGDIAGIGSIPLIFILSLGKYDGVLGFNSLIIPGPLAAISKWVLEYTKVLEMRGKILGRIIWIVAEHVVFFLARTILRPTQTAIESTSTTTQQNVHTKKNS